MVSALLAACLFVFRVAMAHEGGSSLAGLRWSAASDAGLGPRRGDGRGGSVGAFLGNPAIWVLPVVFPMVMLSAGRSVSPVSNCRRSRPGSRRLAVILFGLMVAFCRAPPLWVAAVIRRVRDLSRPCARYRAAGRRQPAAYSLVSWLPPACCTCVVSPLVLVRWPAGQVAVRAGGGLIALAGWAF